MRLHRPEIHNYVASTQDAVVDLRGCRSLFSIFIQQIRGKLKPAVLVSVSSAQNIFILFLDLNMKNRSLQIFISVS